ncbi:MAG: hypothetical protein RIS94_172 [Pseudomonadota bacterium]
MHDALTVPDVGTVAADFFHARHLDGLSDCIAGIARRVVDRLAAFGGAVDFAQEIASSIRCT